MASWSRITEGLESKCRVLEDRITSAAMDLARARAIKLNLETVTTYNGAGLDALPLPVADYKHYDNNSVELYYYAEGIIDVRFCVKADRFTILEYHENGSRLRQQQFYVDEPGAAIAALRQILDRASP
jgi:hypothetical protein